MFVQQVHEQVRVISFSLSDYHWNLNEHQQKLVEKIGLRPFAELPSTTVDHNMITSLVERWRLETNTFHFTSNEATITLKDMTYIYRLPIDVDPDVGVTFSNTTHMIKLCQNLLDIKPPTKEFSGVVTNVSWFHEVFGGEDSKKMISKEEDERVARAYLFALWPNCF